MTIVPQILLGALLTILQNRLASHDTQSDVLLFGKISTTQQEKTDDKQDKYIHVQHNICKCTLDSFSGFDEAVIMERDYFFQQMDDELMNFTVHDKESNIQAMIKSFSNQQFLGYCCLGKNKILDMNDVEKQRCQLLIQAMNLQKIYFGIFSMTNIRMQNGVPEQGQNYDTNNIIRFQYRMFEMYFQQKGKASLSSVFQQQYAAEYDFKGKQLEFVVSPIKLNILNLVSTSQLDNVAPMQAYNFVNKDIIKSMDQIAEKVKHEIVQMTKKREDYFKQIRSNEKEYSELMQQNKVLKDKFEALTREINELMHQQ